MKSALLAAAKAGGAYTLARLATRRWLRILCYHGLWVSEGAPHGECLFMHPEQFESRMTWLARSAYPVLDLDEAITLLHAGTLPDNAVVITIDDGWRTTYTGMLPVLERLGLPATLYVSTYYAERQDVVVNVAINHVIDRALVDRLELADLLPQFAEPVTLGDKAARARFAAALNAVIDTAPHLEDRVALMKVIARRAGMMIDWDSDQFRYMSPAELRDAEARGLRIELHTHRHRSVDRELTDLAREIVDNRAALASMGLAGPQDHFCYPSGDYTPGAEMPLGAAGIRSATNTSRYLNPPALNPFRLGRFVDGPRVDQTVFEAYLAGVLELIDHRNRRRYADAA